MIEPRTPPRSNEDRRYGTMRWRRLTPLILGRAGYACWVEGCPREARVKDHIVPVYVGMPDIEFYDPGNLRASCKYHNLRRGHVLKWERDLAGETDQVAEAGPARSRFAYGQPMGQPEHKRDAGFLRRAGRQRLAPPETIRTRSQNAPGRPITTVTRSYAAEDAGT